MLVPRPEEIASSLISLSENLCAFTSRKIKSVAQLSLQHCRLAAPLPFHIEKHPQLGSYTQTHQHCTPCLHPATPCGRAPHLTPLARCPTNGVRDCQNNPGSDPTHPNIRPNPSTDVRGSSTPSRHPRGGCLTHSLTLAATNPSQASSQTAGRFLLDHEAIFSRQHRFDTVNGRVSLIPPPPNTMAVPGILCPYARYLLRIPVGAVVDDVRGYPMQGCTNSGHDGSLLY